MFSRLGRSGPARLALCAALAGIGHAHAADGADGAAPAEAGAGGGWHFSGYDKLIAMSSSSAAPGATPYDMTLNRLRLKLNYENSGFLGFQAHVEGDFAVKAGSYLDTPDFRREKSTPARLYWRDGRVLFDAANAYGTLGLFRAYAKFSAGAVDVTIGRQRIPLGTGRLWSTLDMLNPINPLQVERDEYVGVDAGLIEYRLGDLSRFSLVYAPDPARQSARWVGQYRTNLKGTDLAFTYGKYWDQRIAGLDFASQIGDAGVRGELSYTRDQTTMQTKTTRGHGKLLLGFDYAFVNTLTLSAEFYISQQRKEERLAQFAQNPRLAQVQPLGGRYAGLSASYEVTPLLKVSALALYNLSEHGRFFSPSVVYSLTGNLNLSAGAQFFSGTTESDFGMGRNLGYVQAQWFF